MKKNLEICYFKTWFHYRNINIYIHITVFITVYINIFIFIMFLFSKDGLGKLSTLSYNNHQKRIIHEFSTSTMSSRRKTYTYFGSSAGSGGKKGGIGSKGHTQCPHCGYTMFHKDTTLCKSDFSYNNTLFQHAM